MKRDQITRQLILKAALECFSKNGYVNTSLNDIVKISGISKGGIYWHFKSKEEMFVQMIEEEYEPWLNTIHSALSILSDPLEKLKKYGELFYSQIDLPVFKLMPESYWGEVGEQYRDRLNQCYSKDDELIYAVFTEAIANNQLRITDAKALTWIYISMLEGLFAELSLRSEKKDELVAYFEKGIDIFLEGIKRK
ncbi:TetR/AcrR family transcriptional regulator [Brevibacillus fluminis]|uniref:TetR/AcrR family transcriptional regulator n=1 Tax=Brevibacillus fluminis TaxID=511487 RepID=A0A3M8CZ63_9BACL|nr:TetR/AcrR family transcriptional regulator [Brevibacillus fluminis]RNB80165.1 TetR/AcrR family transcriptional regulator [Brevibacillus fluminis]